MTSIQIAASTMAADAAQLGSAITALDAADIDLFHWDVMDGHFVPNFTFGPHVIKDLRPLTDKPFDVHLLVTNPQDWIAIFAESGANSISFHAETTDTPSAVINMIHDQKLEAGMALNPETELSSIPEEVIARLDRLVIMTVHPGFGGQKFIPQETKIIHAAALRQKFPKLDIMIDGGINQDTAPQAIKNGATTLVSGSALMQSASLADMIVALKGGRA